MNLKSIIKKTFLTVMLSCVIITSVNVPASLRVDAQSASQQNELNQYVPLRTIAEKIGASVTWFSKDKSIIIEKQKGQRVVLFLGKQEALVNGVTVNIEQNELIQSDKTYISLPTFNRLFSTDIKWNDENETIIFSPQNYEINATQFVYSLLQNDMNTINELSNDNIKSSLPVTIWPAFSHQVSSYAGKIRRVDKIDVEDNGVHTNVHLTYIATSNPFVFTVRFDKNGLVDDFMLNTNTTQSIYSAPSYDTGDYTEKNIVIGEGAFAIPGTITIPKGEGPFPVVILVHGSGPHDRDSTIGGTKIFKDIAAGLASKNIAVVRYDKVTYEHTAKVSVSPNFTLKNESADDVSKVIENLKTRTDIKQNSIYVAGHSQGGFVMPMILEQNKNIAGAILLSAPSTSFIDALIEQQYEIVDRFKTLGLEDYAALQSQNIPLFEYVKSLLVDQAYSKDNIPSQFPLTPAYWWFEQRDYVPSSEMVKFEIPLLITQGENDWQVTMNQFEGWKKALENHKDATFISYAKMNHLLTDYNDLSVSTEYSIPANVSEQLIVDVAKWILN